jgi:hypothetical protein
MLCKLLKRASFTNKSTLKANKPVEHVFIIVINIIKKHIVLNCKQFIVYKWGCLKCDNSWLLIYDVPVNSNITPLSLGHSWDCVLDNKQPLPSPDKGLPLHQILIYCELQIVILFLNFDFH